MLRPRIIPCLLVHKGALVKTVGFSSPKYVGDPINAVRIFNEKQADELMLIDIDATRNCIEPNYKMIAAVAAECRMPLCYGGGVSSAEQVERIVGLGVEKVAISSAAVRSLDIVRDSCARVGSQSVVVVIDVKRGSPANSAKVTTQNGTVVSQLDAVQFASAVEAAGAGELVVNSVDRDGTMQGYDIDLIGSIRDAIRIPLTALGGAGSLDDIKNLFGKFGIVGGAAGSLFVFKGRYRAVLINYPSVQERMEIYGKVNPGAVSSGRD